jgi:hypothetical protein
MMRSINPNHPKQNLLFFVAQDIDDNIRMLVRDFVSDLSNLRHWVNGPPSFIDDSEDATDQSYNDMPTETLGGCLEIYSALPPWVLPREIDAQHLDEVTQLIKLLCLFSAKFNLAFELELDGNSVGAISNGIMDKCLEEGLLGEWRRQLGVM